MMKSHKFLVQLIVTIGILILHDAGFAKIPEPDNIIYGMATENASVITLKVDGETIASYTMGSNPDAGDYYILRVPLDALDPQEPGTARPDDVAEIYIDGVPAAVEPITIGKRGNIQIIDLIPGEDSDGDGLSDAEELQLGTNPHNTDTDGDGLSDYNEANNGTDPLLYDSDGDGYSDGYEIGAGTNANNPDEMPVIYVDAGNISGIEHGTADHPYDTIGEGVAAAPNGYAVVVARGFYGEAISIKKDIRLLGETPTETTIDAGGAIDAVTYDNDSAFEAAIEGFTITNADNGITTSDGNLTIRNNVITGVQVCGIKCGAFASVRIINNTISDNSDATGICSSSSEISVVNNIITDNDTGIDSVGMIAIINYNNLWNNVSFDYVGCSSGTADISDDPGFADFEGGDFHLTDSSPCLDAGDPVEMLTNDYGAGSILTVDEVTNIEIGDRIWLTNGTNSETDIVSGTTNTTIEIEGEFMDEYLASSGAYVLTDTSGAYHEPEPGNSRIDIGAYGNTAEAGPRQGDCHGDLDGDGDVDGSDLAEFTIAYSSQGGKADLNGDTVVDSKDMALFAENFGRTGCP